MYDVQKARVAALYRATLSADTPPRPWTDTPTHVQERARRWRDELAKSIAKLDRRRRQPEIVSATDPVGRAPLRAVPGLLIVGSR